DFKRCKSKTGFCSRHLSFRFYFLVAKGFRSGRVLGPCMFPPLKSNIKSAQVFRDLDVLELATDDETHISRHSPKLSPDWPEDATLEEINFTTSEFWVQAHNLPLAYLTKANAAKIASIFPGLVELEFKQEENFRWSGILSMKVKVNIEDPLKTGQLEHVAKECLFRLDGERPLWPMVESHSPPSEGGVRRERGKQTKKSYQGEQSWGESACISRQAND
ncbi:hypothetical protein CCACVL1_28155, partial [Corchorus capsularis]